MQVRGHVHEAHPVAEKLPNDISAITDDDEELRHPRGAQPFKNVLENRLALHFEAKSKM